MCKCAVEQVKLHGHVEYLAIKSLDTFEFIGDFYLLNIKVIKIFLLYDNKIIIIGPISDRSLRVSIQNSIRMDDGSPNH